MNRSWQATLIAIVVFTLTMGGCAGEREQLLQRGDAAPVGIDLSGQWRLIGSDPLAKRARDADVLVNVFLETGQALKVTQTDEGLFISFDRAIVEEYRFGELREASVGPVVADRASGWDGDRYVIETRDLDGIKLLETYQLENDGQSLLRTISILPRKGRRLDFRQVFERR